MLARTLTVRVSRRMLMTTDVTAFELVHPWGRALPGYRAGAHIDVYLPGGFMRQYSLAQAPVPAPAGPGAPDPGCARYVIGVKREPSGRGGSASLHERVQEGDLLAISTPRNTFPLHPEARHHLLLAGGIGLTPLLAMAQQLAREGGAFTLCVFARSREHLAFAEELVALGPNVRRHFDEPADPVAGSPAQRLDIAELLRRAEPGTHLYLCGPAGFMRAVLDAAAQCHWPEAQVHLEYFAPPAADAVGLDEPFTLVIAGRGIELPVAADQSAVDALHDIGIDVPTSCSQGVCGTCVVPLAADETAGGMGATGATSAMSEPDHRDHCLTATERRAKVALCCSRARAGGRLVVALA
ncbi:MAG: oxidoreductase [Burkholderiales bacterium]|nr:oxidoreductase [Burkholderiales bacterium]